MIRQLLYEQRRNERIAVIENGNEIRHWALMHKALATGQVLKERRHENIAIFLPNGSDYIAALFGVIQEGLTAFPINILLTAFEIYSLLKQASIRTIITSTAYYNFFEESAELKSLSLNIIFIDTLDLTTLNYEHVPENSNDRKPMLLLSTSGTGGKPKIVQLSEGNIVSSVLGYLDKCSFNDNELSDIRYTLAMPFSSVYGIMIIFACLIHSFPIIVLGDDFTLDALYLAAEKYKITHYEGSTSTILLMEQMADRRIPYDIHTLKYFGFGGSKVSGSTIEKLIDAYPGMEFYQGYGMTEAAPQIAKHPHTGLRKPSSVGTAINCVELFIDAGGEITNAPNISGEIVVKGPNVMLGYLNDEAETNRVLKNGYLYTGDIGYIDDEGYLYISGRKKNMIIVRGFNVYPEEIEDCIQNSTLVKDCFVYSQMDEYNEEIIFADIVPIRSDVCENDIFAYCKVYLAQYKQPRKVTLCKSIVKGATGKTKRH